MDRRARWVALGVLALALVFGVRRFLRIADPDASRYARPPGGR
jgi:hypothetical protein